MATEAAAAQVTACWRRLSSRGDSAGAASVGLCGTKATPTTCCLPFIETDEQLAALDRLVGYYRRNEKRMRYAEFRAQGLPIGSGIVESAHKHVLQVRMKQAGQRWSILRGRRMVTLRAAYRTAGPRRFHRAIREALTIPPARPRFLPSNAPRRVKRRYLLHRGSCLNRAALAASI